MATRASPKTRIQRTQLENGMVILSKFSPGKTVAFGIGLRHHAIYDRIETLEVQNPDGTNAQAIVDRAGESHVLEHLLLKGTPGQDFAKVALALERVGEFSAHTRRFGIINWMHVVYPNYPQRNFDEAFKTLMRLAAKPTFSAAEFDHEKEVVVLEIHRDHEPLNLGDNLFYQELYPGGPLSRGILGTEETIRNLKRTDFDELYRNIFIPQNIVIASYGAITHEKLVKATSEFFRHRFKSKPIEDPLKAWKEGVHKKILETPCAQGVRKPFPFDGISSGAIAFGWSVPPYGAKEFYALKVLEYILGPSDKYSGMLTLEIREKHRKTYRVDTVDYDFSQYHGCMFISSITDAELLSQFEEIFIDIFRRLHGEGVTKDFFEAGKAKAIAAFELAKEDKKDFLERMFRAELFGRHQEPDEFIKNISAVKRRDVNEVLKNYFDPERMVRVLVKPTEQKQ